MITPEEVNKALVVAEGVKRPVEEWQTLMLSPEASKEEIQLLVALQPVMEALQTLAAAWREQEAIRATDIEAIRSGKFGPYDEITINRVSAAQEAGNKQS